MTKTIWNGSVLGIPLNPQRYLLKGNVTYKYEFTYSISMASDPTRNCPFFCNEFMQLQRGTPPSTKVCKKLRGWLRKTNVYALCGIFILFFHHAEGLERVLDTSCFSPPTNWFVFGSFLWVADIFFFVISAVFKRTHCKSTVPKTRKKISQKWNCSASFPERFIYCIPTISNLTQHCTSKWTNRGNT